MAPTEIEKQPESKPFAIDVNAKGTQIARFRCTEYEVRPCWLVLTLVNGDEVYLNKDHVLSFVVRGEETPRG